MRNELSAGKDLVRRIYNAETVGISACVIQLPIDFVEQRGSERTPDSKLHPFRRP
jgi:hypothetical protein